MRDLFPEQVIDLVPKREVGAAPTVGEPALAGSRGVSAVWYSLYRRHWTGLVVVSPDDSSRTWPLVQALAATAALHHLQVTALSAMEGGPARVNAVAQAIASARKKGDADSQRFLVAIDSPLHEPAAMAMLEACDAVLLLLWKERTRIHDARRLLDALGPGRVIGAVLGSW
jgi:hypothetical protein